MNQFYPIPENPVYDPKIRALLNSDDASATGVFNPLFRQLIENTHALRLMLKSGEVMKGTGDPTSSTPGAVGQFFLSTESGALFMCLAAEDGVYTWISVGGGVMPQIVVMVATGSLVICTGGAITLEATSADGQAVFNLPGYGHWTVQATLGGQSSNIEIVTVDSVRQFTATLTYFSATLTVTTEAGAEITASRSGHSYTGTAGDDGKYVFNVYMAGSYTVTATKNGAQSSTAIANVTTTGQDYTLELSFVRILGVSWDYSNPSTALTRLTRATDPNSLVNVSISNEPIPAVGSGAGSSPFDKADAANALSLLGTDLSAEIGATATNWAARKLTDAEAAAVRAILGTAKGKAVQDALAEADVTVYVKKGISYGLSDAGALIYFADGVNQYGTASAYWKTIAQNALKTSSDVTAMYDATAPVIGTTYKSRRERTYKAVLALNLK